MSEQGMEPMETAEAYLTDAYADSGETWRVEEMSGDVDAGLVTVLLGRYEESDDTETLVETAEGHGATIAAAIDAALGRTPDESPVVDI
jgi:hypothetical protein